MFAKTAIALSLAGQLTAQFPGATTPITPIPQPTNRELSQNLAYEMQEMLTTPLSTDHREELGEIVDALKQDIANAGPDAAACSFLVLAFRAERNHDNNVGLLQPNYFTTTPISLHGQKIVAHELNTVTNIPKKLDPNSKRILRTMSDFLIDHDSLMGYMVKKSDPSFCK